ncbi:BnaA04g12410D [Brassica napus]|nr:BnaA04g12410D [Brassica napus]
MMLAWQQPDADDNESHQEAVGKESEDKRIQATLSPEQDDISLFYSDIMPLLADHEPSVGEDAFVYLASIIPLHVDVINGRYTFETLTAPTGHQLHFPAYDMFVKEILKCMKHLQKQAKPKGVELADDEIILHVEGTMASQRVVRHIKETSWPGRLTLTNYGLYFEAAGIINYEDALKIDLTKDGASSAKPISTGPWGAPLFDKAIVYESPDFEDGIVLEFPEMTSSTRRDHWLMLVKEITLMHQFLKKNNVQAPSQVWEVHSRTILGIIRLHAAREMLRISPPDPKKFLIFSLFEEVPKGDFVLEELAEISIKVGATKNPCSASSILRSMNMDQLGNILKEEGEAQCKETVKETDHKEEMLTSLESAVNQTREEEREIEKAKATTTELEEEGITESVAVLMELMRPLQDAVPWFQEVLYWERPSRTLFVLAITILIVYKEWVGKGIAACLIWLVVKMAQNRQKRVHTKKEDEVRVSTESDQTVTESIVSAQYGLIRLHQLMQHVNITIMKLRSIYTSKATKHANMVMASMLALASFFAVVPFKLVIIFGTIYCFVMTSSIGKRMSNDQSNRRMKEWWDSIPIVPVRVLDSSSK